MLFFTLGHGDGDSLFAIRPEGDRHQIRGRPTSALTSIFTTLNSSASSQRWCVQPTQAFVYPSRPCARIHLTIYIDTGIGRHRQLFNISELTDELSRDWYSTLFGFYMLSGEDCTSPSRARGYDVTKKAREETFHKVFSGHIHET